ncbi:MAG: beta-propeller fold lactonase family protein [Acidobacteriota bacterium]
MNRAAFSPSRRFLPMLFLVTVALSSALAATLDAETLIVANKSEASVSLLDLNTGAVAVTLPTGEGPHEVAVSPDGTIAVVTDYGVRGAPGSSLTVVDVPNGRVTKTIDLDGYKRPHGILFVAPERVIVTAEDNRALIEVDLGTGEVLRVISTAQRLSHMVAATADGKRAFVANIGSGTATAIDLERGEVLRHIETGEGAEGVAVTPDGSRLYVTNRAEDTVSVIDVESLKVIKTLKSEGFPIRATATPDGSAILVSNARAGTLSVINTETETVVRTIDLPLTALDTEGRLFGDAFGDSSVPIGILVLPDSKTAYVAHTNADQISVVDLTRGERVGHLVAGKEPDGMAYSPLVVKPVPSVTPPPEG